MKNGLSDSEKYNPSSAKSDYHGQPAVSRRKRHLLRAGYGMFAAILFVAFVTASFPYADTISALVAPMRMKVVFQRQKMRFPVGARLENVSLLSTANEQLLLQSPDVTISPRLGWLFLGQLRLQIRAQIYGGALDAAVHQSAQTVIADFELESLNLADMIQGAGELQVRAQTKENEEGDALPQLGVVLSGELSGSGSAQVTRSDIITGRAGMILTGRHVKAAIVNGLPPLDLGDVRAKVLLEQGVATLQDVRTYGSDGSLEANGEIRFAPDIANSIVKFTVSLTPTARALASYGFLLNMLPHAPNDGPYHVEGVLTSPSVS
ncbi:MAG: type II secretion system protein GspN [Deltaproteobacteria bacterium]|nr:type II secretion system protein GspN [Deltaproteobacteria bacterium]